MLKKFRIGFAAIIAILALTVTVASHAGAFNGKLAKAAVASGCFLSVTTQTPPAAVTIQEGDLCSTPLPSNRNVNLLGEEVTDVEVSCDESVTTPICCIYVVDDVITGYECGLFDPEAK